MSGKITTQTLSKVFAGLTEYLDSKYRGHLYGIKSFSIKPGCGGLDNFLSAIYAVHFSTELFTSKLLSYTHQAKDNIQLPLDKPKNDEHEYRLICKSQVVEEEMDSLAKYYWNIIFTKEKMVYSDVLEKLEELSHGCYKLSPKMHHYYSEGEEYSCIILDDLVSLGYYIPKTLDEGLTLEECKVIMKNLARLHALSLVLESKEGCPLPSKYEICTTEMLFSSGVEPACKPLTYNSFLGFLKLTEKFRPDLFPHLKKIDDDENVWNRLCEFVKPAKSSFSCFCHGDPRLNNIFIDKTYSSSSAETMSESTQTDVSNSGSDPTTGNNGSAPRSNTTPDGNRNSCSGSDEQREKENKSLEEPGLRFIDFQLTRYASPVTDLQYALHMGTSRQFREKHTDIALETYYNEFRNVLSRFSDAPLQQSEAVDSWTLEKLKEEYKSFYMYGFLVSVILLPMILLRPGDIDKSMSQMTRAERGHFFSEGRIDLVCNIGSKNDAMRERLFELCDEMVEKNVISQTTAFHTGNL